MQHYRIVRTPHAALDVRGHEVCQSARTLGVDGLSEARVSELLFVRGNLSESDVTRLCDTLLADPAAHSVTFSEAGNSPVANSHSVEVAYLPGVMDPLALQLSRAAQQIGLPTIEAATGTRYELYGDLTTAQIVGLAERLLCNATVQRYALGTIEPKFITSINHRTDSLKSSGGEVNLISLTGLDNKGLQALSKTRLLSLSLDEMRAIRAHFESIDRAPTDVELETLAQTWSEHCVHKTFKAIIEYTNEHGQVEIIDGLLKSTIRAATEKINAPWVRSAFVDNAGIIAFDDNWDLSFKVETHNHPSALEPFGGANTGVGGVIRDIMGVSARPIAITDVLCFGPQGLPHDQLPAGTLHPRRVKEGVVAGVADYGNKLGIPTVAGAVYYDPGYTANPLVFAGCVGIAPRGSHPTGANPGDYVIVLGGRTGRDGLHGATFSSDALAHDTGQIAGTAVQIGNPIVQKDVMEVIVRARDAKLYTAITDCGAGGLSSAVGEMAEHPNGVDVELADVPLKYPGLVPWEIWLSEAQERMVLAVNPVNWIALRELCADWDVEATRIGTFTDSGRLIVRSHGKPVADLTLAFMKDGLPRLRLKAIRPKAEIISPYQKFLSDKWNDTENHNETLLSLLSHPNIASKEDIIRRYDHEVRGGTVIKPFVGRFNDGPSDAAVLKPLETPEHNMGFALGIGIATYSNHTGFDAVCEAINNVIAVGADPHRIAILDNFCWGDPKNPEQLGALVDIAKRAAESAEWHQTPFISGKDSLNNTYVDKDRSRLNIPGALVISAIGIVPDVTKAITMDLKTPGNRIYALNCTGQEDRYDMLFGLMQHGLIAACHDVCDGSFAVALAEMCIAGQLGIRITHHPMENPMKTYDPQKERLTEWWFGVMSDYFVVEAKAVMSPQYDLQYLGEVTENPRLIIDPAREGKPLIDLPISELTAAYKREGKYAQ